MFSDNIAQMKYPVLFLALMLAVQRCATFAPPDRRDIETGSPSERAAVIFERGNERFKLKDYAQALAAFDDVIARYPGSESYEPALYLAAFSNFKLGRFKEAANLGTKYIKEFPQSKYYNNAVSLTGESYYNLGDDYQAAYYLTKYHVQTQDASGKRQAFERILELLPKLNVTDLEKLHRIFMADAIDEHILYHLAQAEGQKGKKEEAERDFNLLMRRFPDTNYLQEAEEYRRFITLGEATRRAGILLPLTGKFSNIGQDLLKVVRAFEKSRQLPFSLHVLDTKSDPIEATLAAAKLAGETNVDLLVAPISSLETFAVCGYAFGKGLPVVLPLNTEARLDALPLVYTRGQSNEDQARMIARYAAYDLGLNRFAVLFPDDEHYRAVAQAFAQEVTRHNREVVAMVSFLSDSITLQKELEAIKKREPNALFLAMDTDMIINAAPQVAYYGLETVRLIGTDSFHSERVPRLGEKYVEGAVFAAPPVIEDAVGGQLKAAGLPVNEFTARFFSVLMKLQAVGSYDRAHLPRLLGETLGNNQVFSIFEISDGEFVKRADIDESRE